MLAEDKTKEQLIQELNEARVRIAELEASEQFMKAETARVIAMLEVLPDLMLRLSYDGTHLAVLAPRLDQLLIRPTDLLGKHVDEVFPPEIATMYRDSIEQTLNKSQVQVFEYAQEFDQLGRLYYEARMAMGGDNDVIVLIHNITERKIAEARLRESEELHRITLVAISDAVFITNDNGDFTFICPNADVIFGYSRQEIESIGNIAHLLGEGLATPDVDEIRNIDREITNKFGQTRSLLVNVKRVAIKGGTILITCRDITERKQAELKLNQSEEIIALKDRIISTVSHEFRTPLTLIKTSCDLLTRYSDRLTEERKATLFQQIDLKIKELTGLIDDMLSISRAQARKTEFSPTLIDVETFCHIIFDQIRFMDHAEHQFEFTSTLSDRRAMIDGKLLQHMLTNMLTNAVKYSPPSTHVSLELNHSDSNLIIRVSDEGIGIPEADQQYLFDPFHRASNVGDRTGTGMGLAIVKEYVTLHGGTIRVESEVGKGSAFIITLPMVTVP